MSANDQNAASMIDISRSQNGTDQQANPHEPECTANDIYAQDCICQRLHVAYNRGREDLADQIRAVMTPFYESPHGKYLAPLMSKLRTVLGGLDA